MEDLLRFLPQGAPGIDGQSADWILRLHRDSLQRLVRLLQAADDGRFPTFWRHSRVTLIPKGDDSPPGERRPLTVMAVTYRLWAKKHAESLNAWLLSWKPAGLSGGIANSSCPDILWEIQMLLAKARTGDHPELFVLSMDLEKCFDRLDLANLGRISDKLGLDSCRHTIRNYQNLTRLLFVDSEPSDVWLHGDNLVGIPQGCPLSCILCNLASYSWHKVCAHEVPTSIHYSYLDDRFVLARSWDELERIMQATTKLDASLGPVLNVAKCARGAVGPPRRRLPVCPQFFTLGRIDLKSAFRYLGIDLVLKCNAQKPVAKRRIHTLAVRCQSIRLLPYRQRGACVADAISALWTDGPFAYTRTQIDAAVSAGFNALIGHTPAGTVVRHSRAMTHVLGPGVHRTHLAAAMAYSGLRQFIRMRLLGRLTYDDWHLCWSKRMRLFFGPVVQIRVALRWLGIQWVAPLQWECGGRELCFELPLGLLHQAGVGGMQAIRMLSTRPEVLTILHEARSFLRHAVLSAESLRRPKDFGGLGHGWHESATARQAMYAMQLHFGGPALSSGGIWTQLAITRIPFHQHTDLCPRCGVCVETTGHRLWECRHNTYFRLQLDRFCPGNQFPRGLPPCLFRCGLIPSDLHSCYGITLDQAIHVQNYLLAVNAVATQAQADAKSGKVVKFLPSAPRCLHPDAIFEAALPPMKRPRPRAGALSLREDVHHHGPSCLPPCPAREHFAPGDQLVISCDGSYLDRTQQSGWGFTVCGAALPGLCDFCGACELDPTAAGYVGATFHSNNVAELIAMIFALHWACDYGGDTTAPIILEYDSEYAAQAVQRIIRTRVNLALVLRGRAVYDLVADRIVWRKVQSHTGLFLNERADQLAKCGAGGIVSGRDSVLRWVAQDL